VLHLTEAARDEASLATTDKRGVVRGGWLTLDGNDGLEVLEDSPGNCSFFASLGAVATFSFTGEDPARADCPFWTSTPADRAGPGRRKVGVGIGNGGSIHPRKGMASAAYSSAVHVNRRADVAFTRRANNPKPTAAPRKRDRTAESVRCARRLVATRRAGRAIMACFSFRSPGFGRFVSVRFCEPGVPVVCGPAPRCLPCQGRAVRLIRRKSDQ
jgi:hypothetical protein